MQGRHGEFEPGKAQYSTPIFFDRLFLIRPIENQNLGNAQAMPRFWRPWYVVDRKADF